MKTLTLLCSAAVLLTGCKKDEAAKQQPTEGAAKPAPTAAPGPVEIAISCGSVGKEFDVCKEGVEAWSKKTGHKATVVTSTTSSTDKLAAAQQLLSAESSDVDVFSVDVVWPGILGKFFIDLKPYTKGVEAEHFPALVANGTLDGKLVAMPWFADAGLLYYRKDIVPQAPATWDEMIADCKSANTSSTITGKTPACYAGQFAKYEGLTVNVAEAINTAGGEIVKSDGKTPAVDTPQATAGLTALVEGFKSGAIPKEAITFQEEQGRQAFEAGKLLFLRNWPYVYNLAKTDASSKVKDTFGIAPLPGNGGGKPGASSLGGHNAAISVYSKHKATAFDFVKFLESEETQKFFVTQGSLAPVVTSLYTDSDLTSKLPYLPVLQKSIANAVPRPVTPFYPAVTKAVQDNAYAALQGQKSVDQALKDMQAAIKSATGG